MGVTYWGLHPSTGGVDRFDSTKASSLVWDFPWIFPQQQIVTMCDYDLQCGTPKIAFSCLKKVAEFYGL